MTNSPHTHTTINIEVITMFDFGEMANANNRYDPNKAHPAIYRVVFRSASGLEVSSLLSTLATIATIVDKFPSTGAAIDHLYGYFKPEVRKHIVDEVNRMF